MIRLQGSESAIKQQERTIGTSLKSLREAIEGFGGTLHSIQDEMLIGMPRSISPEDMEKITKLVMETPFMPESHEFTGFNPGESFNLLPEFNHFGATAGRVRSGIACNLGEIPEVKMILSKSRPRNGAMDFVIDYASQRRLWGNRYTQKPTPKYPINVMSKAPWEVDYDGKEV